MLQPLYRRSWAPRGQTPVQEVSQRHDRLSVIAAVSLSPLSRRLGCCFDVHFENIRTDAVVSFLRELHYRFRKRIILVWDRWSVHHSAARIMQRRHPQWFQFEWLPAYAPELNPVEQLWKHSKYTDLANHTPNDKYELYLDVHDSLDRQRTAGRLLRSYFHHAGLKI